MLHNYLKIAFRNLRRHKVSTIINIGGLALGLACCILLFLFLRHEGTDDQFHEKAEYIYRVVTAEEQPSGAWEQRAGTPPVLGAALEETFPQVEEVVRLQDAELDVVRGQTELEQTVLFADPSIFRVFDFQLLEGDLQTALDDPGNIVLTEQAAREYFGSENPIGRRLSVDFGGEMRDYLITGVVREAPENSSIRFDVLLPISNFMYTWPQTFRPFVMQSWDASIIHTYALLSDTEQAADIEGMLPEFVAQRYGDDAAGKRLRLQPFTAVHLSPEVSGGLTEATNPLYSYILAGIALLVLLIACINFMTLSLGHSAGRSREVGIRKVAGAKREQLVFQFWGEALLTSAFALLLGTVMARLLLPALSRLAEVNLSFDLLETPEGWLGLALLTLVVGIVAGAYPALVLSGFRPAEVLKGRSHMRGRRLLTRTLVVVQFAVSIAFVAGAFIMSEQLRYLSEKALGFNEEQVIVIDPEDKSTGEVWQLYEPFRNEIAHLSSVRAVTSSFSGDGMGSGLNIVLQVGDTTRMTAYTNAVENNFLDAMGIALVAGQDLSKATAPMGALRKEVVVNQALVRALGWPSAEDAIGREVPVAEGTTFSKHFSSMTIVGVVEDFHFQSLHTTIAPLVLAPNEIMNEGAASILVRIAPENIPQTLARLNNVWEDVAPDVPFNYEFLDEIIDQQYRAEERWRAIVGYASGFALLIACFGLFALAALTARRRTKEIGIRKVLGASLPGLVALLSNDFLKLVGIAFVIAAPVAYFAMQKWLQDFAYRIELDAGTFLLAGVLAVVISLATVSYQAIRAALADPVDALRSE